MFWQLIILAITASKARENLVPDTFLVYLNDSKIDCQQYVAVHLAEQNVAKSKISKRINYKFGKFGSLCSMTIKANSSALFNIRNAKVFNVSKVPHSQRKTSKFEHRIALNPTTSNLIKRVYKRSLLGFVDNLIRKIAKPIIQIIRPSNPQEAPVTLPQETLPPNPQGTSTSVSPPTSSPIIPGISNIDYSMIDSSYIHEMTGVDKAQKLMKLSGKGIKIAIIDTGVDYMHPALGGGFGPNFKVSYGYDLVGDRYSSRNLEAIQDPNPMDNCSSESHGTHIAGIVAGKSLANDGFKFTGVAPDATIGAYRIFGCEADYTSSDVVAAAIMMAANAGSDIINLSVGMPPVYADKAISLAIKEAAKRNILVVAGAGNDGMLGSFTTSYLGNVEKSISVASVGGSHFYAYQFFCNGVTYPMNFGKLYTGRANHTNVSYRFNQESPGEDDGVESISDSCKGKACLIRLGSVGSSNIRCENAAKKGATFCILYGDDDDLTTIYGSSKIPSLYVGKSTVTALKNTTARFFNVIAKKALFPNPYNSTRNLYSSYGFDGNLNLKPDISGVGEYVLSTISSHVQQLTNSTLPYMVMSGTSMAAPNVAGCLALLLEKEKKMIDIEEAKARILNSATPVQIFNNEVKESTIRQGAGLINIYKALNSKTVVYPPKISLFDDPRRTNLQTISVCNQAKTDGNYQISSSKITVLEPFMNGDDAIQVDKLTKSFGNLKPVSKVQLLTVPANSCQNITVDLSPPKNLIPMSVYSGFIHVSSLTSDVNITVPYAGMVGDWSQTPIISTNSPSFSKWFSSTFVQVNNTISSGVYSDDFSFQPLSNLEKINATNGIPILLMASTLSASANITIKYSGTSPSLLTAKKLDPNNLPLPYLYSYDWTPFGTFSDQLLRNSPLNGQFVYTPNLFLWQGQVGDEKIQLPPGSYMITLSALKHFGDSNNTSHYQAVVSPNFQLVY